MLSRHQISDHACIRMVNIGRLLLDPNFKKISYIGEYLKLIVMYWEASQNWRGAVNLALQQTKVSCTLVSFYADR